MKKIVVLTGAGISAESGLQTFRDAGGLWEGFDVMEVASIDGWRRNRELVLDFYNMRRKQALEAKPNPGHFALAELEKDFEVVIVTQNVDKLHEMAGSSNVIHLHGQLFQSRSSLDENLIYEMDGWELKLGDKCERGSQLRPNIVWFGEMVPLIENAAREVMSADVFMVVGTSLAVYPAASLLHYTADHAPKFIIDPSLPNLPKLPNFHLYEELASTGVAKAAEKIRAEFL
ncbi:MAG: NAD-dependent deacylase [Imperialibacter sp.]|uniref:SIR2 family NAD-dependent protein deacylase n=1 Tax=Imperialibacter sp. TaxID=2038411 RepID=UPI0032EFF393